jgi:membrane protein YdbS with pleckstrin-like domain
VNTIAATNARRAVSVTQVVSPGLDERKPAGNRALRGEGRFVLADAQEEIFLEARRHGIVLARPLFWAVVLAVVGGVLATLPWPLPVGGFVVVTVAAVVALRAVWKWERTRVVVTTEKVFVVDGTLRRRARAVRLAAVEALELEQSFAGQLLGYGTVIIGPLALEHIPRPKRLYQLIEHLAD